VLFCATIVVMILAFVIFVGLCLGSFVNALVWRVHEQAERTEHEEQETKKKNTKAGKVKLLRSSFAVHRSKSDKLSILHGRSMCPYCHHELAAKDLIPVFSWLRLRG